MADRYHRFAVVTYNGLDDIQNLLNTAFKYAYILHDKDETDPHYHILCSFKGNKSFNAVKKLITGSQNTFVQQLHDLNGAYIYLTHEERSDKALYSEDDIVTNDRYYFLGSAPADDNLEFVHDLLDSDKNLREMAYRWGRDYIRNYHKYQAFKAAYISQLSELEQRLQILGSMYDMTADDSSDIQRMIDDVISKINRLKGQ